MNKSLYSNIHLSPQPSRRCYSPKLFAPVKSIDFDDSQTLADDFFPTVSDFGCDLELASPAYKIDDRELELNGSPYKIKKSQAFDLDSIKRMLQFEEQPFEQNFIKAEKSISYQKSFSVAEPIALRKLR